MKRFQPSKYIMYLIILGSSVLASIIEGNSFSEDLEGLFSWIFLGLWVCISINFVLLIRKNKEYHEDMNRVGSITSSLFVAAFYTFWGKYTTLFQMDVGEGIIFLNIWQVVCGIPYIIGSWILLIFCVKKYFFVYIGEKSLSARITGMFLSFCIIVMDIAFLLIDADILNVEFWNFEPYTGTINHLIIGQILLIFLVFLIGLFNHKRILPSFSTDSVASQINDIDRQIEDVSRFADEARRHDNDSRYQAQQERQQREQERRRQDLERRRREQEQREAKRALEQRRKTQQKVHARDSHSKAYTTSSESGSSKKIYQQLKPKTGTLSQDDFKCIFCFELPNKNDSDQYIILCPKCNYPAHSEEFISWVGNSNLCSRCGGEIPVNFRRSPKTVPTSLYLQTYNYWKKKIH